MIDLSSATAGGKKVENLTFSSDRFLLSYLTFEAAVLAHFSCQYRRCNFSKLCYEFVLNENPGPDQRGPISYSCLDFRSCRLP